MRRTAADAAETRRRVVDAATLTFAEHGYDATFAQIGTRIGMTRGAVHHHFRGGKDELLAAVLTEQWTSHGATVLAPLHDDALAPATALHRFVTGYLARLVTDETFRALATVTTLVAARSGAVGAGLEEHRHALDAWRGALHAVLARSTLRPGVTADAAVFVLVSVVLGANDTAAIEPDRLPRSPDARRSIADGLVGGLTDPTQEEAP